MQSNHVTVKDLFDPGMHNNYDYCNVAIGKNDHHNAFSRIQQYLFLSLTISNMMYSIKCEIEQISYNIQCTLHLLAKP